MSSWNNFLIIFNITKDIFAFLLNVHNIASYLMGRQAYQKIYFLVWESLDFFING